MTAATLHRDRSEHERESGDAPDSPSHSSTTSSTTRSTTDDVTSAAPTAGRARPIGLSSGTGVFLAVFVVGAAIARLTGAAAVVLLLVGASVSAGVAALAGRRAVRRLTVYGVRVPTLIDAGRPTVARVDTEGFPGRNTALRIRVADGEGRTRWTDDRTEVDLTLDRPGVVDRCIVAVETPGPAGLVWWRRTHEVPIDTVHVAPTPAGPLLELRRDDAASDGVVRASRLGAPGELDGLRPWRVGDGENSVHWPTSLRTGDLIGHDRLHVVEDRWDVPRREAARFRHTLEEGLRRQIEVTVDGVRVTDAVDAARRSAELAEEERPDDEAEVVPFWRRPIDLRRGRSLETDERIGLRDRLLVALCTLLAVWMLQGALGDAPLRRLVALVGVAATTGWSLWFLRRTSTWWSRAAVTLATLGALARVAADTAGIDGFIEALRGPMPDLLMFLVVLHGAEIGDRRTARTHLAINAAVVAYATGLRIDPAVGWWLAAWSTALVVTLIAVSGAGSPPRRRAGAVRERVGTVAITALAGITIAALVPVPDGPASLGLPAVSQDRGLSPDDGALLGPDGSPAASSAEPASDRGALGQAGGYPGFSATLDTSIRGDLGDEIVMRVRAPEPAFWRGQTFTEFDGRVWRVTPESGVTRSGPRIDVPPTLGDRLAPGVEAESFVQTFHVEADLPNVIFAAARPDTVLFDGSLTLRTDGALRADRVLSPGTVYSVVSQRVAVTSEMLRAQGDLGERFSRVADEAWLQPFLEIPESTSQRTLDLADRLRVDGSTYDTVRAYESWIATNTVYDLNAPVPSPGADAVDDHLFESRRGFCEQISSSLVVMLRSQGVPARLATGYIPGERDRVSGVWQVRARHAHAWVEVWFPETGWQAFDPTADVPLAGEAERGSVGGDVLTAAVDAVAERPVEIGALVAAAVGFVALIRRWTAVVARRRRGRWGALHDDFVALLDLVPEDRRPIVPTAPAVASAIGGEIDDDGAALATAIAERLDRAVADPTFDPTDDALHVESQRALAEVRRRLSEVSRRAWN